VQVQVQRQQQIPYEDDRKKSKGNDKREAPTVLVTRCLGGFGFVFHLVFGAPFVGEMVELLHEAFHVFEA